MKHFFLACLEVPSFFWRLLPTGLRHYFILFLILIDSRGSNPTVSIRRLFGFADAIDLFINERAMAYGSGQHPKHRLTNYHSFFVERISPGQSVLDVGCGVGSVAKSIALAHTTSTVIGIDLNKDNLRLCQQYQGIHNLSFYHCDATVAVPPGSYDVVILSNVLEHISRRHFFLVSLMKSTKAHTFLIRVPLFERHWHMPLRVEVGANHLSDPDHKIEYTLELFKQEITASGLQIAEIQSIWGEIWANCRSFPRNL